MDTSWNGLKRSPFKRKTQTPAIRQGAQHPAGSNLKSAHKGIPRLSAKRKAEAPARRECIAKVIERDGWCVFPRLLDAYRIEHPEDRAADHVPPCWGPLTAHEPAHSRNVGRTNPDTSVTACWTHNEWAEANGRALCERIGFVERGNGYPIHHVHPVIEEPA